jgi:chromatin segregation and condensation protein Rec8/ScpA/Scc1 (kleisin family)
MQEEFESSPDAYKVKLETFEGPLDLLLHLIRKNEVNIYDIPISLITEQYLGYIGLMQELNLDVAGEFLVMAATLIHIKSKMLLPRPETAQDVLFDDEDPRDELVRRLLEHQKFKSAAEMLHEREITRSSQFTRPDSRVADAMEDGYETELEVDLFSLLTAFRGVLERASRRPRMVLPPEQITIEGSHPAAALALVGARGVRVRGSVRRRRRVTPVHDRHVSRVARDDPPEADSRLPIGFRSGPFASTSARGPQMRRTRSGDPQ